MQRLQIIFWSLVAAGAIALVAWHFLPPPEKPKPEYTAAQSACLKAASDSYYSTITKRLSGRAQSTTKALESNNGPAADVILARLEYAQRLEDIRLAASYCNNYAACVPGKPNAFAECYVTVRPDFDDDVEGGIQDYTPDDDNEH